MTQPTPPVPDTLAACADAVLRTDGGREKTALSRACARAWFAARDAGPEMPVGTAAPPLRPARPEKPELLSPRDVPRRRPGSCKSYPVEMIKIGIG